MGLGLLASVGHELIARPRFVYCGGGAGFGESNSILLIYDSLHLLCILLIARMST